jgi:hypothetical protein
MSIQDIITAIILVILCTTFMIFVIAEIIRDGKRVAKHWKDESVKEWVGPIKNKQTEKIVSDICKSIKKIQKEEDKC